MRKVRNISAVFFAFLFAGVVGVGTAQADTPTGVTNCGTDKDGNILYGYNGNCSGFDQPDDDAQAASNATTAQTTTNGTTSQSYSQSQPAGQTQVDQPVTKTEPKKKPAPEPQNTGVVTATVASSTSVPDPLLPLWGMLIISGGAAAYAFVLRRANAFWQA